MSVLKYFILGKCNCGCNADIPIRSTGRRLQYFINGHSNICEKGPAHPSWKGGRKLENGYILVKKPEHHFADHQGYIREHRLIWEQANNAILLPWGIVHHKDRNKKNNSIENLQAMMDYQHISLHHKEFRNEVISIRICHICKSNKTHIIKSTGICQWYSLPTGEPICYRCYQRIWKQKNRNR